VWLRDCRVQTINFRLGYWNVYASTRLSLDIICYCREREFKVGIKFATSVRMQQLRELLSGKQVDTPQEALSVFDIVLKEVAAQRYIFSITLLFFKIMSCLFLNLCWFWLCCLVTYQLGEIFILLIWGNHSHLVVALNHGVDFTRV